MRISFGKFVLAAGVAAGLLVTAPIRGEDTEKKVTSLLVDKLGDDAKTIRVTVTSKEVVLTGEVQQRSTRELAKEVALAVPGVKKIDNQVKAKNEAGLFGGKVKSEAADAKLESSVDDKLKDEVGKDSAKAIEVEAVDGVVCLRGHLTDATKKSQVLKAVQGVEGVTSVIDLIMVK